MLFALQSARGFPGGLVLKCFRKDVRAILTVSFNAKSFSVARILLNSIDTVPFLLYSLIFWEYFADITALLSIQFDSNALEFLPESKSDKGRPSQSGYLVFFVSIPLPHPIH